MGEDMDRAERVIREAYDAFNRGDFDAAAEHLHPDVRWQGMVETAIEGKAAVRANMEPQIWSHQRIEIKSIEAVGDCLVVDGVFHTRGAGSGIEMQNRSFQLWRFKDGKGISFEAFAERDEALAAAREPG